MIPLFVLLIWRFPVIVPMHSKSESGTDHINQHLFLVHCIHFLTLRTEYMVKLESRFQTFKLKCVVLQIIVKVDQGIDHVAFSCTHCPEVKHGFFDPTKAFWRKVPHKSGGIKRIFAEWLLETFVEATIRCANSKFFHDSFVIRWVTCTFSFRTSFRTSSRTFFPFSEFRLDCLNVHFVCIFFQELSKRSSILKYIHGFEMMRCCAKINVDSLKMGNLHFQNGQIVHQSANLRVAPISEFTGCANQCRLFRRAFLNGIGGMIS